MLLRRSNRLPPGIRQKYSSLKVQKNKTLNWQKHIQHNETLILAHVIYEKCNMVKYAVKAKLLK